MIFAIGMIVNFSPGLAADFDDQTTSIDVSHDHHMNVLAIAGFDVTVKSTAYLSNTTAHQYCEALFPETLIRGMATNADELNNLRRSLESNARLDKHYDPGSCGNVFLL